MRGRPVGFPWERLEPFLIQRFGTRQLEWASGLNMSREAVGKCRSRGRLSPWTADRCATALGVHPATIWPEYSEWIPQDPSPHRSSRKRENAASQRARYRRLDATAANGGVAPDHVRHGTESTYNHWNCRCGPCRKADADARSLRRLNREAG